MNHTTSKELSHWVTLTQTSGIGIARIKKLLQHFHSIEAICNASTKALQANYLTDAQIYHLKNPNQLQITLALKWLERDDQNHIILFTDSEYPGLLSEIVSGPAILYVRGAIGLLSQRQIAMVGSRKPTHTGRELAHEFAFLLAKAGVCITSGLALGIDAASHEGALKAQGKTIAVLGSGLNQLYPKQHLALSQRIVEADGCVVSELPLDEKPLPVNFPRRNRIISGLCVGTLVVEAALQSGSLITAHYALEQNRDVYAIPGSLRNPMSTGCLSLIQQGARCVTSVNDILNEFPIMTYTHTPTLRPSKLDCIQQQVLACIDNEITTIDQICTRSKLSAQQVIAILLQCELDGTVLPHNDGYTKQT